MKKSVMVVLAGLVSGVMAADPADEAWQAALKLRADRDFAAASAAFRKIAADFPALAGKAEWSAADCFFGQGLNAEAAEAFAVVAKNHAKDKTIAASALRYQGVAYARQRKYGEALVPFDKALADYPEEAVAAGIDLERLDVLRLAKRYGDAVTAAEKVLAAGGEPGLRRARAQAALGLCYEATGKKSEAQAMYMSALTENIRHEKLAASHHSFGMFELVNPSVVGAAAYKEFVTELILLTPATEENVRFLGRLKSELEKIKE